MNGLGTITTDGDTRTVRFERRYPAAREEVWAAITEPARLREWLTEATFEPGEGGRVAFDFGEGGACTGTVTVWDAPSVLEYGWDFPDESRSVVRWELAADGDGTVLTLVHRLLTAAVAPGYGAGWHAHLDQLGAHLVPADGDGTVDWDDRYRSLRPEYDAMAGG
jgi:uncharacterized protein YndB with AHSA1/START domain